MTTAHRPIDSAAREHAQELIRAWDPRPTVSGSALGSILGRVTSVDQVGVEERVASLRTRSIKKASKLFAGQESHGAPPGSYFLLFWFTFWPGATVTLTANGGGSSGAWTTPAGS